MLFATLRPVVAPLPSARPHGVHRAWRPSAALRPRSARAAASQDASRGPFRGTYGEWWIEDSDIVEVWTYRAGLTVTAGAFAVGTLAALLPPDAAAALQQQGTALAAVGAAGLGVSLWQIHIYVAPLKRLLQAFWAAGVLGGAYLALAHGGESASLPALVEAQRWAVWLVGPAFAALAGVGFKEGVCYGKPEAFGVMLALPALLLGHLSGLVPEAAEHALGALTAGLLVVFAAGKYGQPVVEDLGDKSVFTFLSLPEQEQAALVARLRAQRAGFGSADGGE